MWWNIILMTSKFFYQYIADILDNAIESEVALQ